MRQLAESKCRSCGVAVFLFVLTPKSIEWVHRDGSTWCKNLGVGHASVNKLYVWDTEEI